MISVLHTTEKTLTSDLHRPWIPVTCPRFLNGALVKSRFRGSFSHDLVRSWPAPPEPLQLWHCVMAVFGISFFCWKGSNHHRKVCSCFPMHNAFMLTSTSVLLLSGSDFWIRIVELQAMNDRYESFFISMDYVSWHTLAATPWSLLLARNLTVPNSFRGTWVACSHN